MTNSQDSIFDSALEGLSPKDRCVVLAKLSSAYFSMLESEAGLSQQDLQQLVSDLSPDLTAKVLDALTIQLTQG